MEKYINIAIILTWTVCILISLFTSPILIIPATTFFIALLLWLHLYLNQVSNIIIFDDTVEFHFHSQKTLTVPRTKISVIEITGTGHNFYLSDGKKLIYRYKGGTLCWTKDIEIEKLICQQNFPYTKFE